MKLYKALRYFLYVRRSQDSEDRQMASLDDQKDEMMLVAKRLGLEIIEVIEESQSAKKPGRPRFNEMLSRINAGEADGILCWKINRLARNPVDGGQISWMLQEGIIKHIQAYSSSYYPTDNVLMMAVELGMANQFVKDLSVDVKRGMRKKAERGWMAQRLLAIGYKHNTGYESGENEILSTPDLKIMRRLFDEILNNSYSASDIQRLSKKYGLKNKKGKMYGLQTIINNLTNPFYCGIFLWRDGEGNQIRHIGRHEAILTEDEFNTVQLKLGEKGRPTRVNKYDFAYRGPITCGECGMSITSEHKKRCACKNCHYKFSCKTSTSCPKCKTEIADMKSPKFYSNIYYHCTKKSKIHKCVQGVIDETDLELQIKKELSQVEIEEDFYKWAVEALKYMHGEEMVEQDEVIDRLDGQVRTLRQRLDKYLVMRADGEISSDKLVKMSKETESELYDIEQERKRINNRMKDWVSTADMYLTFADRVCVRFSSASNEEKREMLQTLGSTLKLKDKKLFITVPNELIGLKNVYDKLGASLGKFDTKKALDIQGLSEQKRLVFDDLCAGRDSNLRRHKSADLQSALVDRLSTDALFLRMRCEQNTTSGHFFKILMLSLGHL